MDEGKRGFRQGECRAAQTGGREHIQGWERLMLIPSFCDGNLRYFDARTNRWAMDNSFVSRSNKEALDWVYGSGKKGRFYQSSRARMKQWIWMQVGCVLRTRPRLVARRTSKCYAIIVQVKCQCWGGPPLVSTSAGLLTIRILVKRIFSKSQASFCKAVEAINGNLSHSLSFTNRENI